VPENLLTLLNYLLIVLLYLFFARVVWTVWSEVKAPRAQRPGEQPVPPAPVAAPAPPVVAPPVVAAPRANRRDSKRKGAKAPPSRLVVERPAEHAGRTYPITGEMTVGRAAGCQISLPADSYASNVHARVYQADGLTFVEDLGSTNGTLVNGGKITGTTAVQTGDRIQVGATVLEVA
jgi:FHA domain